MEIQRVGVVGAGTMGSGIAHVFAKNSFPVVLCDVEQRFLDRGLNTISKNLEREVGKGKISAEDKQATFNRIEPVLNRAKLSDCDFVVEAATERVEIKAEIFRDLDQLCRPEVILASNTSSISITRLATLTSRPEKIIGMHFFNPVPVMKLVEVIRGLSTSDETFLTVRDLAAGWKRLRGSERRPRIRFQPRTHASAERSHVRGDGGGGHCGGGGRGFQAGHGTPHGSADTGRFYRPGCLPGYYASAPAWIWRPQVPAMPAARQDGGCRMAGQEERARFLPLLAEMKPRRSPGAIRWKIRRASLIRLDGDVWANVFVGEIENRNG